MRIIIPTYRRTDRQFTLRCVPDSMLSDTHLIVDRQDAKELANHPLVGKGRCNIVVHPTKIKTIAQKRAWIIRRFDGKILMLDDDLRFARREYYNDSPPYQFRALTCGKKDVLWAFKQVDKMLDDFVHVGIGARQGNNGLQNIRVWNQNYRMMYALGYRTEVLRRECKLGRIEHREDMDMTLQLLTKGFENRVLIDVVVDQIYNSRGGASSERSVEASNADAELLASWFPDFVKVVQKNYSISVPRKEVVCAWKKAAKYGMERSKNRASRQR